MVTTWHTGLIFPYYFISFTYPCPSKPNWTSWKIMARVGGCYFLLQSFPVFWKKIPITKFRGDKMGIFSWCSSRVWKKKKQELQHMIKTRQAHLRIEARLIPQSFLELRRVRWWRACSGWKPPHICVLSHTATLPTGHAPSASPGPISWQVPSSSSWVGSPIFHIPCLSLSWFTLILE